jgi:hypothetical protein
LDQGAACSGRVCGLMSCLRITTLDRLTAVAVSASLILWPA